MTATWHSLASAQLALHAVRTHLMWQHSVNAWISLPASRHCGFLSFSYSMKIRQRLILGGCHTTSEKHSLAKALCWLMTHTVLQTHSTPSIRPATFWTQGCRVQDHQVAREDPVSCPQACSTIAQFRAVAPKRQRPKPHIYTEHLSRSFTITDPHCLFMSHLTFPLWR